MKWPWTNRVRRHRLEYVHRGYLLALEEYAWTSINQRMDGTKLINNAIGLLDPFRGPVDKRAILGPDHPPPPSARSIRELHHADLHARRCHCCGCWL